MNPSSYDLHALDQQQGAGRYLNALRERWLLVTLLVGVAVGAAVLFSATAEKRYEAQTDVLVTPVSASDPTFVGIGLLRESSDQSRSIVTAARFVKTPQIADAVQARLGTGRSRDDLLNAVEVTPLGQSNIVTIQGQASSPELAATIANTFAEEMLAQRSGRFKDELERTIDRLRVRLAAIPAGEAESIEATALRQRLGDLSGLVGGGDPTLQITSAAVAPAAPVWPRPVLSIAVALLTSLLLGSGLAIALANPKVTSEEELLLDQRLPILARVPRMRESVVQRYLAGREPLPGDVREAYRTLRASLALAGKVRGFPRTILVTSAIPGEGKSMTSANLASTIALAGQRVILVDGDLRRPMIATIFGVAARPLSFGGMLAGRGHIKDALVSAPGHGDELRLLPASPEQAHLVDLLDTDRVERVFAELREQADVVIVDSSPLTEVSDALTLADEAEAVLVAVRLGHSRRDRLNELRRMLAQRGIPVAGFVVTTNERSRGSEYTYGFVGGPAVLPPPAGPAVLPPPAVRRPTRRRPVATEREGS